MVQEIFTYLIIAIALVVAIFKIYSSLAGKKKNKQDDYKKETYTLVHDCSDCAADCSLRDAIPGVKLENAEVCNTNVRLKDS